MVSDENCWSQIRSSDLYTPCHIKDFPHTPETAAVQAIKGVPACTNVHSSAREPNQGQKSLFLKKNLKF